ncbi:MAG: restriction endonuclease subunit S [Betaproteobacteria bacterium]
MKNRRNSPWLDIRLGDVIPITHGFAFKGEYFRDQPSEHVLVTPGNFALGGGFQLGQPKYYVGPVPEGYVLDPGDLVVTMTDLSKESATLGYAGRIPDEPGIRFLHNQRLGRVRIKDRRRIDKEYLHYLMRSSEYRAEILASSSGTAVKHTSPSRIEAFRPRVPANVGLQRKIARVLSALDEKIESNRRMNRAPESTASALFKSLFIDFDPVVARAAGREPIGINSATAELFPRSFKDSELGRTPVGWRVWSLDEIGEFRNGLALQRYPAKSGEDSLPVIKIAQMTSGNVLGAPAAAARAAQRDFLASKLPSSSAL